MFKSMLNWEVAVKSDTKQGQLATSDFWLNFGYYVFSPQINCWEGWGEGVGEKACLVLDYNLPVFPKAVNLLHGCPIFWLVWDT